MLVTEDDNTFSKTVTEVLPCANGFDKVVDLTTNLVRKLLNINQPSGICKSLK